MKKICLLAIIFTLSQTMFSQKSKSSSKQSNQSNPYSQPRQVVQSSQSSGSNTDRGDMYIGGLLNFTGNTRNTGDTTITYQTNQLNFNIYPNFGYFVGDGFAIGGNLSFGIINNKQETLQIPTSANYLKKDATISFGVGGFARKYFDISDKVKFILTFGLGYNHSSTKFTSSSTAPGTGVVTDPESKTTSSVISTRLFPGIVFFPTPHLGVEASFGSLYYIHTTDKTEGNFYPREAKEGRYGLNFNMTSLLFGVNYYF